jgi:hypothetical protein
MSLVFVSLLMRLRLKFFPLERELIVSREADMIKRPYYAELMDE